MKLTEFFNQPIQISKRGKDTDEDKRAGGGDGFEHLMIYINDVWTKVV